MKKPILIPVLHTGESSDLIMRFKELVPDPERWREWLKLKGTRKQRTKGKVSQ